MAGDESLEGSGNTIELPVRVGRKPGLLYSGMLAAVGLVAVFLGAVYGVLLVGVPYQDPTPEMARREAFHVSVSGWIMAIGVCMLICGVLALVLVAISRILSRVAGSSRPT